jgi:hypothetical protein
MVTPLVDKMISQPTQRDHRTRMVVLRFSWYEIGFVLMGCVMVSFRTGRMITTISNATPKAAITTKSSECNSLFLEIRCPKSETALCVEISEDSIDNDTCSAANVETLHEIRRNHQQRRSNAAWAENGSVLHHDDDYSATVEFFEAMVHPALLIHPNPYRIAILNDIGGQILQQVLKHNMVHEVIYILPESFKNTTLSTNSSDSRIVMVYTNDLARLVFDWRYLFEFTHAASHLCFFIAP